MIETGAVQDHIAVWSAHPDRPLALEDRFDRARRAAIAVNDHNLAIGDRELLQFAVHGLDDFLRIEVMHGGHAINVDIPAVLVHDRLDLFAQSATDEQGNVVHRKVSNSGNWRTEMNESLKSDRPDSSTYSILSGSSKAIWRSRKESSDILATSPRSATVAPITSINTLMPVAIDPLPNCSSRTSRWLR